MISSDFNVNEIEAIKAKPYEERTEAETELLTEWRVAIELDNAEFQENFNALQKDLEARAQAMQETCTLAETTLAEMRDKAFELLERANKS